jgi:hypothetical protein
MVTVGFVSATCADTLRVTVDNNMDAEGFFLTPLWVSLHKGGFDVWRSGDLAGDFPGLEDIAEEGNTLPISAAFAASPAGSAGGVQSTNVANGVPVPVFSPGESAEFLLTVGDSQVNPYLSYASMVIPSNDLFVATSVPTMHEVFDADGDFVGPLVIRVYGADVVDAGTEVNDIAGGAAFSALGGVGVDESNPLADIYDLDPGASFLNFVVGTTTATGDTVESVFGEDQLLATIRVELVRGDASASGRVNFGDVIRIFVVLFMARKEFRCDQAADVNDSGAVTLDDAIHLLRFLFFGRGSIAAPYPHCGLDVTADLLSCESFRPCD